MVNHPCPEWELHEGMALYMVSTSSEKWTLEVVTTVQLIDLNFTVYIIILCWGNVNSLELEENESP